MMTHGMKPPAIISHEGIPIFVYCYNSHEGILELIFDKETFHCWR